MHMPQAMLEYEEGSNTSSTLTGTKSRFSPFLRHILHRGPEGAWFTQKHSDNICILGYSTLCVFVYQRAGRVRGPSSW